MRITITPELHKRVKRHLLWQTASQTANKFYLSKKTVIQIRGTRTFEEYAESNKAQHPGTGHSLKEDILELHKLMFDKHDNKYLAPLTATKAALVMKVKLLEDRRNNEDSI